MAKTKRAKPFVQRTTDRGEYRSVYVAMIDSPEYRALSLEAAACLWPLKLKLGRTGIAVFEIERLPSLAKMGFERVLEGLTVLVHDLWLTVEDNVFWLRNGLRFDPSNPLASPNMRASIQGYLYTLPKLKIVNDFAAYYELPLPFEKVNPSRRVPEGFGNGSGRVSNREYGIGMRDEGGRNTESILAGTFSYLDDVNTAAAASLSHVREEPAEHPPLAAAAAAADEIADADEQPPPPPNEVPAVDDPMVEAMVVMANVVDAAGQKLEPLARNRFTAAAVGLVDGSDVAVWQDQTGSQIAWSERPRLMKLALARRSENGGSLRSALRYVIPQQLDPFPMRHQDAARFRRAELPQDTTHSRSNGVESVGTGIERVMRAALDDVISDDDVAQWEQGHPTEAVQLFETVSGNIDPQAAMPAYAKGIATRARYRSEIRQLVLNERGGA